MEIIYEDINNIGYMSIIGRIDASNYKDVENSFFNYFKINKSIIIDLSLVSFMDSTGLGSIVSCLKYSKDNHGILRLTGVDNKVKIVFTITKANKIFEIFPDKETALLSFNN